VAYRDRDAPAIVVESHTCKKKRIQLKKTFCAILANVEISFVNRVFNYLPNWKNILVEIMFKHELFPQKERENHSMWHKINVTWFKGREKSAHLLFSI